MGKKFKLIYGKPAKLEKKISIGNKYYLFREKFIESHDFIDEEVCSNIYDLNVKNVLSVISADVKKTKLLLSGEVQSGKTNNIIFLISALQSDPYNFNKFIFFTGTKNNLNDQNKERLKEAFKDAKFTDFSTSKNFFKNDNSFEIFYGIKQNINNLISLIEPIETHLLKKINIVIFDDECDEASAEKGKTNRTVNEGISRIIDYSFNKVIYTAITATPYANLTSYSEKLMPNYVIPLVSSDSYCGLEKFLSEKTYVEMPEEIIQELKNKEKNSEKLNNYLQDILMNFFVECYRDNKNYKFLVNISIQKEDIEYFRVLFHDQLGYLRSQEISFYSKYLNDIEITNFKKTLNRSSAKMICQGVEYNEEERPEIIVGGNLLSRGITFNNLLYQIMLNISNTSDFASDTLLQRARWFGYRDEYIHKMKIFTSKRGCHFYQNIYEVDSEIRGLFEDNYKNDGKIEKIKKIFEKSSLKWTN